MRDSNKGVLKRKSKFEQSEIKRRKMENPADRSKGIKSNKHISQFSDIIKNDFISKINYPNIIKYDSISKINYPNLKIFKLWNGEYYLRVDSLFKSEFNSIKLVVEDKKIADWMEKHKIYGLFLNAYKIKDTITFEMIQSLSKNYPFLKFLRCNNINFNPGVIIGLNNLEHLSYCFHEFRYKKYKNEVPQNEHKLKSFSGFCGNKVADLIKRNEQTLESITFKLISSQEIFQECLTAAVNLKKLTIETKKFVPESWDYSRSEAIKEKMMSSYKIMSSCSLDVTDSKVYSYLVSDNFVLFPKNLEYLFIETEIDISVLFYLVHSLLLRNCKLKLLDLSKSEIDMHFDRHDNDFLCKTLELPPGSFYPFNVAINTKHKLMNRLLKFKDEINQKYPESPKFSIRFPEFWNKYKTNTCIHPSLMFNWSQKNEIEFFNSLFKKQILLMICCTKKKKFTKFIPQLIIEMIYNYMYPIHNEFVISSDYYLDFSLHTPKYTLTT